VTKICSLNVRREQPADATVTEQIALQAFAPDVRVAELVRKLRASDALITELNLVAEADGIVVGHLMLSRAAISSGHLVALLSPLGVLPDCQRQGVGSALMRHAMDWLKASDFPLVVVEGVPEYYPRFGFSSAHAMGIEPPYPLPAPPWMAYRLPAYHPSVQGTVTYPEPFDFLHDESETHR
jgi:putative acetyltransferase